MRQLYKVNDNEMTLLPLGCDTLYIERIQSLQDRDIERKKLGLGPDDLVIFTGGKLTARKKFEILAEAIDCKELSNVHIIVSGKVPDEDVDYATIVGKACEPVKDRVHFKGWQLPEGMYQLMHLSDLAVFTASQSVMWQGAIGSGLPLVVGDSGGQDPSYLNCNENVVILPPDGVDVLRMRQELITLAKDRAKLKKMAKGALKTAKEHLDWSVLAQRTLMSPSGGHQKRQ